MKKMYRLVQVTFDMKEIDTKTAVHRKELVVFETDDQKTGPEKMRDFIALLPPPILYLGRDNNVYPQFLVEYFTISSAHTER